MGIDNGDKGDSEGERYNYWELIGRLFSLREKSFHTLAMQRNFFSNVSPVWRLGCYTQKEPLGCSWLASWRRAQQCASRQAEGQIAKTALMVASSLWQ